MKNNFNYIWGGIVVAVVIAITGLFYPHASQVVSRTIDRVGAITDTSFFDIFDAKVGFKLNGTTILDSTGLAVINTTNGTTTIGGVTTVFTKKSMLAATSTACSILSPAATSTLLYPTVATFDVASTAGGVFQWGKSNTVDPTATTTALSGLFILAANEHSSFYASTTGPLDSSSGLGFQRNPVNQFPPSTWLVGKVSINGSTGVYTQYAPNGTCIASFMQLN